MQQSKRSVQRQRAKAWTCHDLMTSCVQSLDIRVGRFCFMLVCTEIVYHKCCVINAATFAEVRTTCQMHADGDSLTLGGGLASSVRILVKPQLAMVRLHARTVSSTASDVYCKHKTDYIVSPLHTRNARHSLKLSTPGTDATCTPRQPASC